MVGVDTYITVEEANSIVDKYAIGDTEWTKLEKANKEKYLINATLVIDSLRYNEGKSVKEQPLAFPLKSMSDVPDDVKTANALEAYELTCFYADLDSQAREKLISQGVKSYSIGGELAETYGDKAKAKVGTLATLKSDRARSLLKKYLLGTVKTV